MRSLILSLGILVLPILLEAQVDGAQIPSIAPDLLQKDLQILQQHLEAVHPDLYAYHSKAQMDSAFSQLTSQLDEAMSPIEFCDYITPLLKVIANGHTDIFPARSYFMQWDNYRFFPFDVYFYQGELYILKNLSKEGSLKQGMRIRSINGEAVGELYQELSSQMTRDGYNETLPQAKLNGGFYRWYASFKGQPEAFQLMVLDDNGQEKEVTVEALSQTALDQYRQERYPQPEQQGPWDRRILKLDIKGSVATMEVPSFDSKFVKKRGKQKFKKFFNEAFAEINAAGVEHLILDLRNNGGGDPQPTIELLSHLTDQPFTFYRRVSAITKKVPDKKLYLDNMGGIHFLTSMAFKKDGEAYEVKGWAAKLRGLAGLKPTQPAKEVFKGKLYVLTNPYSFSATGEFSAMLKELDRGIFIGEEAGGNPNQNASGIMLTLQLPHSQNRVAIPMILFEVNVSYENTGRGIIPDHIVQHPPYDILNNKDTTMDFALGLIQKSQPLPTAAQ